MVVKAESIAGLVLELSEDTYITNSEPLICL